MATQETAEPETVCEVVFDLDDPRYPFVGVSEREDCRVELARMIPRRDGAYAEYFSISGTDPDSVVASARESDLVEPTMLTRHEDGGVVEFLVRGQCPAQDLAELGAFPQEVRGEAGEGRIRCEVLPSADASEVVAEFLEAHPSATFVAKCEKSRATPLFTEREVRGAFEDRLTDRQREVLLAAYGAGYYDVPRETEGQEIAADLDISQPTFSQHLRAAERKLISLLYDDRSATS